MLTILKTVILAFVWLVLPILTGCLFGLFPQREYRKRRSAYLIGSLTIWALFYGLARIALDGKWTLTKLTKVFCVLLAVLTILSTGVIIYRWHMRELIRIKSRTSLLFTAVAAVLILAVAGSQDPAEGVNIVGSHVDAPRLDLRRTGRTSIRWSRS